MDKETLRSRNMQESTPLSSQPARKEASGGLSNTRLGKRKKRHEKRNNYLQDWLDKALQQEILENESDFGENAYMPNYYNAAIPQQQRIYPAVSDPSFCRYNVPVNPLTLGYPLESLSLPFYSHSNNNKSNQHIPQHNYNIPKNTYPTRTKNRQCRISQKSVMAKPTYTIASPDLHFTSLPPVEINAPSVEDNQDQRRFSDPGLGSNGDGQNSSDSDETNGSSCIETVPKKIITTLVEQISSLKEVTAKLSRDVFDMRGELEQMKQQSILWSRRDITGNTISPVAPLQAGVINQGYTPGMLADAIREVRDSTKVREEAFMLRFKSLLDERNASNSLYAGLNGIDSISESGRDLNELTRARINKLETECRLERLEEDLRALRLQNEVSYSAQNGTTRKESSHGRSFDNKTIESEREREMEMEILDLRREVQEAKAGREEAIEKSRSHERLVTILRKKLHSVTNSEETLSPEQVPIVRHQTVSLSSNGGPSHLSPIGPVHNGYVTMSGPVTDLGLYSDIEDKSI